jgi:serine/threonine protein phosphatase PrpC
VSNAVSADRELRDAILDGFERANREVTQLGVGAATTLAVAEVDDDHVRSYHAGDSEVVAVGQRGRLKLQTVSHSPVAYGVEAGLIHQDDAIDHVDRNIVSNMVGSPEMRIEIGSPLCLRPRDRLLVATDGVFDNLSFDELVEHIRKGPIDECCSKLTATCHARMTAPKPGEPSKPDDVSMILFSRQ